MGARCARRASRFAANASWIRSATRKIKQCRTGLSMSPLLIFDGKCAFCRIWIEYSKTVTGDRVEYAPSQQVGAQFPQIAPENFGKSVQLVFPDGEVVSGARAAIETLRYSPRHGWLVWLYESVPLFAVLCEWAYRHVAAHRTLAYHVTRLLFGRQVRPLSYDFI